MAKIAITFRLEKGASPVLKGAAKKAGMKVSNFVEEAVLEKLAEVEQLRTSQEIENLREEIVVVREELALSTEAVLIVAGSKKPYPTDDAIDWVRKHLKRRKGGRT